MKKRKAQDDDAALAESSAATSAPPNEALCEPDANKPDKRRKTKTVDLYAVDSERENARLPKPHRPGWTPAPYNIYRSLMTAGGDGLPEDSHLNDTEWAYKHNAKRVLGTAGIPRQLGVKRPAAEEPIRGQVLGEVESDFEETNQKAICDVAHADSDAVTQSDSESQAPTKPKLPEGWFDDPGSDGDTIATKSDSNLVSSPPPSPTAGRSLFVEQAHDDRDDTEDAFDVRSHEGVDTHTETASQYTADDDLDEESEDGSEEDAEDAAQYTADDGPDMDVEYVLEW